MKAGLRRCIDVASGIILPRPEQHLEENESQTTQSTVTSLKVNEVNKANPSLSSFITQVEVAMNLILATCQRYPAMSQRILLHSGINKSKTTANVQMEPLSTYPVI